MESLVVDFHLSGGRVAEFTIIAVPEFHVVGVNSLLQWGQAILV